MSSASFPTWRAARGILPLDLRSQPRRLIKLHHIWHTVASLLKARAFTRLALLIVIQATRFRFSWLSGLCWP